MKTRSHKQQRFHDRYGPWAVVTGASSGIGRELAFRIAFASQGRGGMILMSSIVGFRGMPFAAHYAATKAYVQALAEALAV